MKNKISVLISIFELHIILVTKKSVKGIIVKKLTCQNHFHYELTEI